jgi:hypothetical protein
MKDGSYNKDAERLALVLAEVRKCADGFTAASLESVVRAIWWETGQSTDLGKVGDAMGLYLAEFSGLEQVVKQSSIMAGAIDVKCGLCFDGRKITHIVHLW